MIIENVTGLLFDQYLKEKIFDVCDMKSTGYYEINVWREMRKIREKI